jgi:hypothetical protein
VLLEPGNKSIKVTWTAPHDDGGTALTGIVATATPGGFTCEAQGARNTCTIRNLMNGSRYRVQVSAVNGQGVGVPSLRSEGTDLMVTVAKNGKTRLTNLISVSTSALKTWSVTGNGCSITSDKAFLKVPNRVGATCVLKLRVAARGAQPARSYFLNVKTG